MNDIDPLAALMIKTLRTVISDFHRETGDGRMLLVALAGISARLIVDNGGPKALELFDTILSTSIERIMEERDDAKARHSES